MSPKRRLLLSILLVAGIYVVGVVGYVVIEDSAIFDAMYMTTITLSTVGFRETVDLHPAGRAWTIVVITLGVTGVSFAITSLVSLAVSGDINTLVGRRKLQSAINQLENHVILCGYGRMGELTIKNLQKMNVEIVVIERDADICQKLREQNILYVQGDATEEETLTEAGLMVCGALLASLSSDAENVYITLTARGLRPGLTIVARAEQPSTEPKLEQPSTEPKLKRAGATRVVCPQIIGATKVSNILTRPNVVDFFEVAAEGIELEMDEFVVEHHSPLCDMTLKDAPIREKAGATVVAIKRATGEAVYQPDPNERIRQGDILIMIGQAGVSNRLRNLTR